ncbi:MAG: hypothetical protein IKV05_03475 [Bacteroidales bacterium]|nr:hypothetical protein [Bacteroidales bacterium]
MNIVVKPYGAGFCYCRPDTSWERENRDLYTPDRIERWDWAPIAFVRISKAGKCVGRKFASRYYDAFGFGALLYVGTVEGQTPDTASASCADHTSVLPFPLYNLAVLEGQDNMFKVFKNDTEIYGRDCSEVQDAIEEAICSSSEFVSLRTGDIVAVELAPKTTLASRAEGETQFKATFCENEAFGFKILF